MKKLTIAQLMKSPKSHLHVKLPTVLSECLKKEADEDCGMNKSLLIISILAERYEVIA